MAIEVFQWTPLRLKSARVVEGITASQLGAVMGVSARRVRQLESGARVDAATVSRYFVALGLVKVALERRRG